MQYGTRWGHLPDGNACGRSIGCPTDHSGQLAAQVWILTRRRSRTLANALALRLRVTAVTQICARSTPHLLLQAWCADGHACGPWLPQRAAPHEATDPGEAAGVTFRPRRMIGSTTVRSVLRSRTVALAMAGVVAVLAAAGWTRLTSDGRGDPRPTSAATPHPLTQAQADDLSRRLTSDSPSAAASAVLTGTGQAPGTGLVRGMSGASLLLDVAVAERADSTTVWVPEQLTRPGRAPQRWMLLLVWHDGAWRAAAIRPVTS
jgi:hypothetical protein